jgi:hypothetical protein
MARFGTECLVNVENGTRDFSSFSKRKPWVSLHPNDSGIVIWSKLDAYRTSELMIVIHNQAL